MEADRVLKHLPTSGEPYNTLYRTPLCSASVLVESYQRLRGTDPNIDNNGIIQNRKSMREFDNTSM